jgi:hypothetical protein
VKRVKLSGKLTGSGNKNGRMKRYRDMGKKPQPAINPDRASILK